ncbi:phosphate/phosphite/phosphonate ABC transporter substrate-binding protein [Arcobacter sp.]|uniref:phosphate/phosphite/phosphonate ABC transporter substrate-binding protein n=1 Tax=Arcobacter sp. TaxID=1872629 RepID=UPI003D0BB8C7
MFFVKTIFQSGQKLTSVFQKLTILSLIIGLFLNANENKITIGLTGVALKEDITTFINLKKYLEKKTTSEITFKFAKSYANIKTLILNDEVDIAYICGSTYVDLVKSYKINLFVIPTTNNKPFYSSLIITQKNSPFKGLLNLKNKIIALSDPESNSASLVPQYEIYKKGYDYNKFFKKRIFTYDHGESIDAVLSGYVDAASLDSVVFQAFVNKNPKEAEKLKVIESFDNYPMPPFIIQKHLTKKKKDELLYAFLSMKEDELGKKILKAMAIDDFIIPKNISYKKIEDIKKYLDMKSLKDDK